MTTLLLLASALAMDSFAAGLSQGAAARPRPGMREALYVGVAFGAAQTLMPLLGWMLSLAFAETIRAVDHWIAFALLAFIGGRMVHAGLSAGTELSAKDAPPARGWTLLALAIATSIDAAAAGVTLPLLEQPALFACAVIGAVTLVLSAAAVLAGAITGTMAGRRAEIAGGIVLFGIGSKILIEHLFFGG